MPIITKPTINFTHKQNLRFFINKFYIIKLSKSTLHSEDIMPLETISINSFNDNPKLKQRVEQLYDHTHEFSSGAEAIAFFEQSFQQNTKLYLGIFNDKPICAVGCFDDGQANSRRLQYIILHPANRGRGIAQKFIKQVTEIEQSHDIQQFIGGCGAIRRILAMYELSPID